MQANNVQLVISHYEGSGGNFLGRLYASQNLDSQPYFRVDVNWDSHSIPINGRDTWWEEVERTLSYFKDHKVLVTHNYDLELIRSTFPQAKLIQMYPWSQVGNCLYNISYKKLSLTMPNAVDNYYIQIKSWHEHWTKHRPGYPCADSADLSKKPFVEHLLGIKFTEEQDRYFNKYWSNQLKYRLTMPTKPMSMQHLVAHWGIEDWCTEWSVAYLLYVYELIHGLIDRRKWYIDQQDFSSWDHVFVLADQYTNQ